MVQTRVQCSIQYNVNENSTRSYDNRSICIEALSKLLYPINTAITVNVKLLTSKVTLLNTCEKLKTTHEKQLDLGNIKSKVNETCRP